MRTIFFHLVIYSLFTYPVIVYGTASFFNGDSSLISFAEDTIPSVFIDSIGRIGLGTNIPQEKLDVQGNIKFSGQLMPNGIIGDSGAVMVSRGPLLSPMWDNNFRQGVWEEFFDKILFDQKNVEVGKTLVNKGFYAISQNTIFNEWQPNIETTPDLPSFTFTGGEFPNPLTSHPNNYVFNFGPNLNSGGGNLNSGKPSFGLGFEYRFFIDSIPYNEFHVLHNDLYGIKQRRPVYCLFAHDGSKLSWTHQLSDWNLHNKENTEQIFTINTSNQTQVYNFNNGSQFKHVFSSSNYQPLWQNDGTGSIFPLIGYLPGRLQLGSPTGLTTLRIGQGFELGNDGSFDYFGTALGDGATNLSFGTVGKRYNTIWFKTNFDVVSRFTNNSNTNGWGMGLDQFGNMYFYDYNSNTKPFILGSSMPDNSFKMSNLGYLCLGGTDTSQRLVVNGNIGISGAIMPNNDAGSNGKVLTSQGANQAQVWESRLKSRNEVQFSATVGQTEFVLSVNIDQPSGTVLPIEVYRNGIKLKYNSGSLGIRDFNYLDNAITLSPSIQNDEIEIVYYK